MVVARNKSVLGLPAQNTKLCRKGSGGIPQTNPIVLKLEGARGYLGNYYYLFMLMVYGGLRISEALNISYVNINDLGQVYVWGAKGSDNKLVNVAQCSSFLLECQAIELDPFFNLNRFSAYRLLKGLNIGKLKKGRFNSSVTHILRDEFIKSSRGLNLSDKQLSKISGHKNPENLKYYGKD